MKGWLWFIIGLLVGAIAMWLYNTYVTIPRARQEAQVAFSKIVEADELAQEATVTGVIAEVADGTIRLETVSALNSPTEDAIFVTVRTDSQTRVYTLGASLGEPRKELPLTDLLLGTRITILSNQPVGTQPTIYAKEIIVL